MANEINDNRKFGVGLRDKHLQYILKNKPNIDLFEIISEQHLDTTSTKFSNALKIRELYPITLHGVSLSLGNTKQLNGDYLKQLKLLSNRLNPLWLSDHLCWTGDDNVYTHGLLPLPYTEETVAHVVNRIDNAQNTLAQRILIENISSYITYKHSIMTEWEFLSTISQKADCYILLDINNIYVNSINHNFNPLTYIQNIPKNRVKQFHIAGHNENEDFIIDNHGANISDQVWNLYEQATKQFNQADTIIERDQNIPTFNELYEEINIAKKIAQECWHAS